MKRIIVLPIALIALTSACELRKPFEANVIAAGASGKNVKSGFFLETNTVGEAEVTLDVDTDNLGRALFFSSDAATAVEITPIHIDDQSLGYVVFDLLTDDRPDTASSLALFTWVDGDDDGKLDLSSVGDSEAARTIFRFDAETNKKAVLAFYNFVPNGDDPYYTATALTGPAENVIVTEDFLKDWMVVLTSDTDAPPPAPDTDGDGLDDTIEGSLGTSSFDVDTDFDGEDDFVEVGDVAAPKDTDTDGVIDALESSLTDTDGDTVPDETDPD